MGRKGKDIVSSVKLYDESVTKKVDRGWDDFTFEVLFFSKNGQHH